MSDTKKKDGDDAKPSVDTANGPADPAPAKTMDSAAGAIIEPEVKEGVTLGHPAVDDNPRADTSAEQNSVDFNDPRHRDPNDPKFAGQGLDRSVYGDAATDGEDA